MITDASTAALAALGYGAVPEADGWHRRDGCRIGRFDDQFAEAEYCVEEGKVRIRVVPDDSHLNMTGTVHGGHLLALIDFALFLVPLACHVERVLGGSTIDCTNHFYAPAIGGRPVDLIGEVMRETGRMVFGRGVIEQDGVAIGGFAGTIRRLNTADSVERAEAYAKLRLAAGGPIERSIQALERG